MLSLRLCFHVNRLTVPVLQQATRGQLWYFRLHICEAVKLSSTATCSVVVYGVYGESTSEYISSMKNGTLEAP